MQVLDCRHDLIKNLLGLRLLETLLLYYDVKQFMPGTQLCSYVNKPLLLVHLIHFQHVGVVLLIIENLPTPSIYWTRSSNSVPGADSSAISSLSPTVSLSLVIAPCTPTNMTPSLTHLYFYLYLLIRYLSFTQTRNLYSPQSLLSNAPYSGTKIPGLFTMFTTNVCTLFPSM